MNPDDSSWVNQCTAGMPKSSYVYTVQIIKRNQWRKERTMTRKKKSRKRSIDEKRTKRAKWDGTSLGSRSHLITLIQTKATLWTFSRCQRQQDVSMRTSISKSCLLQWNLVLASYVSCFNLVGCTAWESSSDAIGVVDARCSSIRGTIHLFGRETCTSLNIGNDFLYAFIPSSNIQKAKWRWNPLCVINNCLGLSLHALFMWPCWSSKTLLVLTILTPPLDSSFGTKVHAKVVAQRIFCMEDAQMHKHFQRHNSSVGRWKL